MIYRKKKCTYFCVVLASYFTKDISVLDKNLEKHTTIRDILQFKLKLM